MKKYYLFLCYFIGCFFTANAAYLENVPQILHQPNGDTIYCFATGDEFYHYLHDSEGYTIVLDPATGYYVYAKLMEDELLPTDYVVGQCNPASVGLLPYQNISAEAWRERRRAKEQFRLTRNRDGEQLFTHINNIVVFIRFADDAPMTDSFQSIDKKFNDTVPLEYSMYNYFKTVSYNKLNVNSYFYPQPQGEVIMAYQDMYERSYYEPYSATNPNGYQSSNRASRESALIVRALAAIENEIPDDLDLDNNNDGLVDNVIVIIAGPTGEWNDLLWPHQWELADNQCMIHGKRVYTYNFQILAQNQLKVSTLCHEMSHTIGAPDLYHYYTGTNLAPVGVWDIMGQTYNNLQHMCAYTKYRYCHWIDEIPELTRFGRYTLRAMESSATNNCYKIASSNENEYFVLEYRNKIYDYEDALPGSGLVIYRINTAYSGNAYYDGSAIYDEVYVYRKNGSPTSNGLINQAFFNENSGRTMFYYDANPYPFLSNGMLSDLYIHQISNGDSSSISFTYGHVNYLEMSDEVLSVMGDDTAASITVRSDSAWQLFPQCEWVSCQANLDSGTQVVNVHLEANPTCEARECLVLGSTRSGVTSYFIVHQAGKEGGVMVAMDTINIHYDTDTFNIHLLSDGHWEVIESPEWLQLSAYMGDGNITLTVQVDENILEQNRTAEIVWGGECGAMDTLIVIQTGLSSLMDLDALQFSIYPNPVTEMLYLSYESSENYGYVLKDLSGRIIMQDIKNQKNTIDMAHLPSGCYLLQIILKNTHKNLIYKVIKK